MKNKDIYGFKVTDKKGGTLIRWFSTSGNLTMPCTEQLMKLYARQKMLTNINEAHDLCKDSAVVYKMKFKTLTEKDWNNTPNPVKQFFNKLFGRNK